MTTTTKPAIAPEAQQRIRSFVHEVEALQERWGVQLAVEGSGLVVVHDTNRKEPWAQPDGSVYGEWDAYLTRTEPGGFRLANLQIEDFDGWGK